MDTLLNRQLADRVYANYVLPFFEPQSYRGFQHFRHCNESREHLPLQANLNLQWQGLLQILGHAYETTKFYRQRFDEAGITPKHIQAPADLKRLPVLTREDIRLHPEEICSSSVPADQLTVAATGGTTDNPVKIFRDLASLPQKSAVQMRFNDWAGFSPGDKVLYFWGARSDFPASPSWRWRLFEQGLMRRHWAPTSLLNEEILTSYREELNRVRPRVIYAYPTPLALICEHLLQGKEPYHRPETVICTAETLHEHQRLVIEKALGCKVFEQYGARDFGMVASECKQHNGLHVNPAAVFIELEPVPGAEAEGLQEMIVTDLLNQGMPLIRYRVNDCTALVHGSCNCGIGYPRIGSIRGRVTDNFYLSDGSVVPGVVLPGRILKAGSGIRQMQIIQERLESFVIRFVPDESFGPSSLANLKAKLIEFLAPGLTFEFEQVEEIPRERSGKTRLFISRVKPAESRPS